MTFNSKFHALLRRSRTALHYGSKNGVGAARWALAVQKLRGNGGLLGKTRIQHYDFVHNRPVGAPIAPGSVPRNTINWVVPPFGYGSGGHLGRLSAAPVSGEGRL